MMSFFFQAEDGIRDGRVTGVQTCALPIWGDPHSASGRLAGHAGASRKLHARARRILWAKPGPRRAEAALIEGEPRKTLPPGPPVFRGRAASHWRSEERRVGKEWRAGG